MHLPHHLLAPTSRPHSAHSTSPLSLGPPLCQLYPEFYCRYEDPSYLKALKIRTLIAIADQTNAYEIAEEMTQVRGWCGQGCCGGVGVMYNCKPEHRI